VTEIRLKRVYDPPSRADGHRILVDRLWPRGLTKEAARVHVWARDAAPSAQLRKSFCHDPAKWDTFRTRYFRELDANPEALATLRQALSAKRVTLLYGARDTEHNNAVALREYLTRDLTKRA